MSQTITTDQGKVYRLEEAWVVDDDQLYRIRPYEGIKTGFISANGILEGDDIEVKKGMVLIPEEE